MDILTKSIFTWYVSVCGVCNISEPVWLMLLILFISESNDTLSVFTLPPLYVQIEGLQITPV